MFQNKVLNGGFTVNTWLRNSTLASGGAYLVVADGFRAALQQASLTPSGTISVTQPALASTDLPLRNAGHARALRLQVSGAAVNLGSAGSFVLRQAVDQPSLADLRWTGSGAGQSAALSFWFRTSSAGGTFAFCLRNPRTSPNPNRQSYVQTFTAPASAGTYAYYSFTIPPPSGTGANFATGEQATGALGLELLLFTVMSAAANEVSATGWTTPSPSADILGHTASVDWTTAVGNYIEFTGVQLECAPCSTPFVPRPFSVEYALLFPTALLARRNRLGNGDMSMNTGGRVATTAPGTSVGNGALGTDRWQLWRTASGAGSWSVAQVTVSDLPGFSYAMTVTNTAGASRPAVQGISQTIEGINTADFNWGTNFAVDASLSFWVKQSVAGLFGVVVTQTPGASGANSYGALYSVPIANAWTYITLTVPAPPSGSAWSRTSTGTTTGVTVLLTYTQSGSLNTAGGYVSNGAWAALGNVWGVEGQSDITLVGNATVTLTGLQLEAAAVSTPFEASPGLDAGKVLSGVLPVAQGGTGAASFAAGAVLLGDTSTSIKTASGLTWSDASGLNVVGELRTGGTSRLTNAGALQNISTLTTTGLVTPNSLSFPGSVTFACASAITTTASTVSGMYFVRLTPSLNINQTTTISLAVTHNIGSTSYIVIPSLNGGGPSSFYPYAFACVGKCTSTGFDISVYNAASASTLSATYNYYIDILVILRS